MTTATTESTKQAKTATPSEGEIRTSVTYGRCGQPRPYADSIKQGTVTVERFKGGAWEPADDISDEDFKRNYSRRLCNWVEKGEWHEPKLTSILRVGAGCWNVVVTFPFTD